MNNNTRTIVIVLAVVALGILFFLMLNGRGTAPTPSTMTTPADTTQPATTDNSTQTQ